jgi:hypothetical protein
MDQSQSPLRGSCSCGRNQYTIAIPTNGAGISIGDTEELSVWFDGGREQRMSITLFLCLQFYLPQKLHKVKLTMEQATTTPLPS